MKRFYWLVTFTFLLGSITHQGYAATNMDCVTGFYKNPSMSCVDNIATLLSGTPLKNKGSEQFLVGFLAEVFRQYPQKKVEILSQKTIPSAQAIYNQALLRAGLTQEAEQYADEHHYTTALQRFKQTGRAIPLEKQAALMPFDNDMLIGAFEASGNPRYVEQILTAFKSLDDSTVRDVMRFGLVMKKFGPALAPEGRKPALAIAMCTKYNCKKDTRLFTKLSTLSSGFWALDSLGGKDKSIRNTFNDFFEKDTRLKTLLFLEQNALGNYLTSLIANAAIKNNPNIDNSLAAYEQLSQEDLKILPDFRESAAKPSL